MTKSLGELTVLVSHIRSMLNILYLLSPDLLLGATVTNPQDCASAARS